jgi:hypothetical protein
MGRPDVNILFKYLLHLAAVLRCDIVTSVRPQEKRPEDT